MDTKAPNTNNNPLRILTVGLRQFRRPDTNHPTWTKPWDWQMMLKLPGLHPERTQTAWDRLHSVGINITTAVDLLPPGGDFLAEEAERAAAYLRGVVEGLNEADLQTGSNLGYDIVALLGGRVADAFCASDKRLHDMRLLSLRDMGSYGVVILPSPHIVETGESWWSSAEKQQALRDAVAGW